MAMYTDEQAQKAIHDKFISDMNKQIALWNHETAVRWVSEYNLPYRVALDYNKRAYKQNHLEIQINPWYPLPQIPIVAELSQEESTNKRMLELQGIDNGMAWFESITRRTGENDENGKEIIEFCDCIDEEYNREQAIIDEKARLKAEPYKPWSLDTQQGLEQWEHHFALYIAPYESVLPSWNSFNMFGDNKHTIDEVNERITYYMGVINRFKADTQGLYDLEPPQKQLADYDLYDFYGNNIPLNGFYMWNGNSDEPPKHTQALQIMQKELALYERANKQEYCYNNEIKKIKAIIKRLEQEQGNE